MRKTIQYTALVMSGLLLLGGCGADKKEQMTQANSNQQAESQVTEDSSEAANLEKPENTDANEAIQSSVPAIAITQEQKEWYTDDGEVILLQAEASSVEVVSEGFDALKDALAGQWKGLQDSYEELEWAQEQYDSLDNEGKTYFSGYYLDESVGVCRNDNHVISFCESFYEYTGGAHGIYGCNGKTYDVKSGKELQLEDILSDSKGFYDKAVDYIIEKLEEDYGDALFSGFQETVQTETFGETPVCWYLDNTGIVIDYGLYLITPYAAGAPSVTLPYDEFAEYIKEDYVKPADSIIARISENEDISRLIGETDIVMLEVAESEEYEADEVTVISGNASEKVGTFASYAGAYVIKHEDGRSFLLFVCDYASDDFVTYVYEVTGGKVRECDKVGGASISGSYMGTDKIGLSMHLDVLGTYLGDMVYLLTDDGKLTQTEEIFTIDAFQELTVIKELPVTLEGKDTTIAAGANIKITGTDNKGTAYFQLDTGETGTIQYVRDEESWQILIDGVSENEYFEMVPYAG